MDAVLKFFSSLVLFAMWCVMSQAMEQCFKPLENCRCQHGMTVVCHSTGMTQLPARGDIPKSYTSLEFINNTFNNISSVDYSWVKKLIIKDCKVNTITPGAFKTMTELETLDLSSNSISSVTKPMFEGLGNLTHLNLGSNLLKSLTMHALCPSFLKSLTNLELEFNMIKELPTKMMISSKLSYLNMGNNRFTELPHHIWGKVKGLKELHMHGNPMKVIKDESLDQLTELETLNLDQCGLTDISNNALHDMSKLRQLYLGNNMLASFESAVVEPCATSLTMLHLQNNKLHTLDQAIGKLII